MPNTQKIEIIDLLKQKFQNSSGIYLTRYTGMNVSQATDLRSQFRENNVSYIITKNTLTKIAAKEAGYNDDLNEILKGQIAIAYAEDDPTAPAKVIKDFSKDNECLEVVGLYFDGQLYSPDKYKEIANLPSKEELLTKFVVALNYPMTSILYCLQSSMVNFVNVLNNLKEQKD